MVVCSGMYVDAPGELLPSFSLEVTGLNNKIQRVTAKEVMLQLFTSRSEKDFGSREKTIRKKHSEDHIDGPASHSPLYICEYLLRLERGNQSEGDSRAYRRPARLPCWT